MTLIFASFVLALMDVCLIELRDRIVKYDECMWWPKSGKARMVDFVAMLLFFFNCKLVLSY
jgi:hypothetical protein